MTLVVTCMPRRAKMKMKRKRSSRSERMEEMAFMRATTRFLRLDQYLYTTIHNLDFMNTN
jgi:hypothetical protein